ncbi:hypothetical protein QP162_07950 [Sphingomonas aurantiaca]
MTLPGVGSWLALAIARKDFGAIGLAVVAMGIVILLYDQAGLPARRRLGGPVPVRADRQHRTAAILGL